MQDAKETVARVRRSPGRPRRLTLDAIVEAACAVGIDDLEMSRVADRLNTGVATLYGYVRGRDHLLELVTQRVAGRSLVKDRGQSWQTILREHADVTSKLFQSMPQLITNLMTTPRNRDAAAYSELIIDMLVKRDIPIVMAADMYIETNQVVIGAAVSVIQARASGGMATDREGRSIPLPAVMGDYRRTLDRIIAGYEAEVTRARDGEGAPRPG